jgi:hypothetical protein
MASPSIRQERAGSANGRHDEQKSRGEIVAVAGDQPHAGSVAPRQDAKAVVLDLVQPLGPARRGFGRGRQAGFDQAACAAATLPPGS